MSKKSNHKADIKSDNGGTIGTNMTYDKDQGNRDKQLNPNQHPKKKQINMCMSKKSNHEADIKNDNKGTKGTNITYDRNQGDRGKQLNPTHILKKTKSTS